MYGSRFSFGGVAFLGAATALAVGCNSTDNSTGGSSPTNASATGVWSGSDSVTGLGIAALINSGAVRQP
jgi:hypothetical protein